MKPQRPPEKHNLYSVYHITAKRALREFPDEAMPVIRQELETLVRKGVFHGREYSTLDEQERKRIIRSQMNITQKFAPSSDGNGRIKDKLKARLVGGGTVKIAIYTVALTPHPPRQAPQLYL
jgi:hypothetical protein